MVAIVSGNGFGLSTGSSSTLGQAGVFGNPSLGNSKEGAYVNVANGNLVLQDQDDFVASAGTKLSLTRTYNSQGNYNNGNGLNWRLGVVKQIVDLTGTVNTAGSTVTRINSDGSRELYRYDTGLKHYISTDGSGAYNHLTWDKYFNWQWTSDHIGSAGLNEWYGSIASGGKIESVADLSGNGVNYTYDANSRLAKASTSFDDTYFDYDSAGNLSQIRVSDWNDVTSTRVHYTYDALNRLSQVVTDLTPNDNSIVDGKVYTTTYSYLGATSQVTSVIQSDGTSLEFGYVQVNGAWKIETATDGLGQVTRFAYSSLQTTVTDPLGNNTVYTYDAAGQLLSATTPPTLLNGAVVATQTTSFAYDANGNVLSVTDPRGKKTSYEYDANGNRVRETSAAGDVTTRTYDPSTNNLLQESIYPSGSTKPALSTQYVYDSRNRLRFVISPERRLTEYTYGYDGFRDRGLCSSMIEYAGAVLPLGIASTEAGLVDWSLSLSAENSAVKRTDYRHDARGLVDKTSTYATTRSAMTPVVMPASLPAGITLNGGTGAYTFTSTKQATNNVTTVTSVTDSPLGNGFHFDVTTPAQLTGSMLTIGLTNQTAPTKKFAFNFAGGTLKILIQNGSTQLLQPAPQFSGLKASTTYTVDISTDISGNAVMTIHEKSTANVPLLSLNFFYTFDQGSNLRLFAETSSGPNVGGSTTGSGNSITVSNLLATPAPQVTSEVVATQYVYDQHGQLLQSIDGKSKTSALFAYDGLGRLISAADADNNSTTTVYDDAGGSRSVTLSNGLVTKTTFDRNGRATSVSQLDKDGRVLSIATNSYDSAGQLRRTAAQNGAASYFLYDEAGRQTAKIDANGDLTAYFYNADNQVTRTIAYAKPLTPAQMNLLAPVNGVWPRTSLSDLRLADADADNRSSWKLYDDAGRLSKTVDAGGALTVYVYDQASRVTQVIRRAYDISKLANVYAATSLDDTASADDQISRNYYTADGKLQLEVDPAGYVTEHRYDAIGQLIETLNYSVQLSAAYLNQAPAAAAILGSAGAVASHERYFYNTRGQLAGTLDNGNFLTELKYDLNGNVLSRRHYAVAVTTPGATKMSGLGYAVSDADLLSSYTYTSRNQVETETAPGGIVTRYTYDKLGKLIETRVGSGATRAQGERYDVQGRLIAELNTEGVAALATAKPEDVDGIWLRYGSRYTYNENGLRLTATDQLGNQSRYYYDGQGNLTYTVNAAGEVTGLAYNGFNQLKSKTNYGTRLDAATLATLGGGQNDANIGTVVGKLAAAAVDSVTRYEYDHSGRQSAVVDALGNRSTVHYDAFGRIDATEQQNVPNGNVSAPAANMAGRNFYDLDGRLKASLTSGGSLTVYSYNALDQLTDRITYAKPVDFAAADLNAALAQIAPDAAHDNHQRYFYDARGLLAAEMRAEGLAADGKLQWSVVRQDYDGNGNLTRRTAYATPLPLAGSAPALAYPADSASDSVTVYAYDGANRLAATATAQNTPDAAKPTLRNWSVVRNTYDALGNLSVTTAYATALPGLAPTGDALRNYAAADAANATTYYTYDSSNRIKTVAVAQNSTGGSVQWAVTGRTYDAAGNLSSTTQYATAQTTSSALAYPTGAPVADAAKDRTTSYRYDALNRLQVSIDAVGAVTRFDYDARGNLIQRTAYEKGVATPDTVTAAYKPAPQPNDRVTRSIYDLDNRLQFEVDALGNVTEHRYDNQGNVSALVRYATPINAQQVSDRAASVTAQLAAIGASASSRTTLYLYDQNRRLRFTLDARGYLTENRYDSFGRVTDTQAYPTAATLTDLSYANVVSNTSKFGTPRTTHADYDAQGNLVASTDALGYKESYGYDGLGRKTSFVNKLKQTWNYAYDNASHLVLETAPEIDVYANGQLDANPDWSTRTPTRIRPQTAMTYDMLGNLFTRTEGANGAQPRKVTYEYDLVGRQIRTRQPAVNIYNANETPSAAATAKRNEIDSGELVVEVSYDMLGNAIANKDVDGNFSYKVYDRLGQVRYDIDAAGYVTGYARDNFGAVAELTRYSAPLAGYVAGSPASPGRKFTTWGAVLPFNTAGVSDPSRTVVTRYDQVGHAIKVIEPLAWVYDEHTLTGEKMLQSARTTETRYDAFGQARQVLVYGAAGDGTPVTRAASTRYYYDANGNKQAQITALQDDATTRNGYLSVFEYDAAGDLTSQTDYATAYDDWQADWKDTRYGKPAVDAANDRITTYGYENRRKTSEVRNGAATSYAYDALGNMTRSTDASGMSSYSYYDALGSVSAVATGRQTALTAPAGYALPLAAGSLTEFRRDIFGNVVIRVDVANGAAAATAASKPTAAYDRSRDRVTTTTYDIAGRAIQVFDAEGKAANTSYDKFGRAAKQWRTVTNADNAVNPVETAFTFTAYNVLGQIASVTRPGNINLVRNILTPANTVQRYSYNAFGEVYQVDSSGDDNKKQSEYTRYDGAGHAWLSNAGDGIDKLAQFDAQGNLSSRLVKTDGALGVGTDLQRATDIVGALQKSGLQRTDFSYDLMGRQIATRRDNDANIYVLQRDPASGAWTKYQQDRISPLVNSLLLVAEPAEKDYSKQVYYRRQGTADWISGLGRLRSIEDSLAFDTDLLAAGTYEYMVVLTPPKEAAFVRIQGTLNIANMPSADKNKQLAGIYGMLLNRAPDLISLNVYMERANKGESLAHLVLDFLRSTEAASTLSGSSASVIKNLFRNGFGRLENDAADAAYASDVASWAAKYDIAKAAGGDAPGQMMLDLIETMMLPVSGALPAAQQSALAKAQTRMKDGLEAGLAYTIKYLGTNLGTAARIWQESATNSALAKQDAQDSGTLESQNNRIAQFYLALFGRAPDAGGASFWRNALKTVTPEAMIANMLASPEAKDPALYPVDGISAADYNQRLVARAGAYIKGRALSDDEVSAILSTYPSIDAPSEGERRGKLIIKMIGDVANYAQGDSALLAQKQAFNNKVALALSYGQLPLANVPVADQDAVNKAVIAAVTSAATAQAAAEQAKAAVAASATAAAALSAAAKAAADSAPMEDMRAQLARMYVSLFNRTLDSSGLSSYLSAYQTLGATPAAWNTIASAMLTSAEATNPKLGLAGAPGLTDAQFVDRIYQLALGEVPTSAAAVKERDGFKAQLTAGNRGEIAVKIMNGLISYQDPSAQEAALKARYNNKVGVALACAADLYAFSWENSSNDDQRQVLSLVTSTSIQAALDRALALNQAAYSSSSKPALDAIAESRTSMELTIAAAAARAQSVDQFVKASALLSTAPLAETRMRVLQVYIALLGRTPANFTTDPDLGGMGFYVNNINTGLTNMEGFAIALGKSAEALGSPVSSDAAFVDKIYMNVLGTSALKQADKAKWIAQLGGDLSKRGKVAYDIMNSVLAYTNTTPDTESRDYLVARQQFLKKVASCMDIVDRAQRKQVADAQATLATQPDLKSKLPGLLNTMQTDANSQSAAMQAAITALNNATGGDGSALRRLQLTTLYSVVLLRDTPPSAVADLQYFVTGPGAAADLAYVAESFMISGEAKNHNILFPADTRAFISTMFSRIMGRAATAAEVDGWVARMPASTYPRGQLVLNMVSDYMAFKDGSLDQLQRKQVFDGKIADFLAAQTRELLDIRSQAWSAYSQRVTDSSDAAALVQNDQNAKAITAATLKAITDDPNKLYVGADAFLAAPTKFQSKLTYMYLGLRGDTDLGGLAYFMKNYTDTLESDITFINGLLEAQPTVYPKDNIVTLVSALYSSILGQPMDSGANNFYVLQIKKGAVTPAEVARALFNEPKAHTKLDQATANRMVADRSTALNLVAGRAAAIKADSDAAAKLAADQQTLKTAQANQQTALSAYNFANTAYTATAALQPALNGRANADTAALKAVQSLAAYNAANKAYNDQQATLAPLLALVSNGNTVTPSYDVAATYAAALEALAGSDTSAAAAYVANSATTPSARQSRQITQLYVALMNRAPQLAEVRYWVGRLNAGDTPSRIAKALLESPAGARATYPASLGNDDFVRQIYALALQNPTPDYSGAIRYWSDKLTGPNAISRADLVTQWVEQAALAGGTDAKKFNQRVSDTMQSTLNAASDASAAPDLGTVIQFSEEAARATAASYDQAAVAQANALPLAQTVRQLTRLYLALFNRAPDPGGLQFWVNAMTTLVPPRTLPQVAQDLLVLSPEPIRLYGNVSDDRTFLSMVFNNAMGRAPTQAELGAYVAQASQISRGAAALNMIVAIADGAANSDLAGLAARDEFNAKVDSALAGLVQPLANQARYLAEAGGVLQSIIDSKPENRYVGSAVLGFTAPIRGGSKSTALPELTLDRWGNVLKRLDSQDPNWATSYTYNANNQLLSVTQMTLGGSLPKYAQRIGYDLAGRVQTVTDGSGPDANGAIHVNTSYYDNNGNLLREKHADGGIVDYQLDTFGQRTAIWQYRDAATIVKTDYGYDRLGRQISRTSAAYDVAYWSKDGSIDLTIGKGRTINSYSYDELGRQIRSSTTSDVLAVGDPNNGASTLTRYDLGGNVISIESGVAAGRALDAKRNAILSAYNAFNFKVAEQRVGAPGAVKYESKSWEVDERGRAISYTDLSGVATLYGYNANGQVSGLTRGAQSITYTYDNGTGLLQSIDDQALHQNTTYSYDRDGRRITERVWLTDEKRALQDNFLRYDHQGRLSDIGAGVTGAGYAVHYDYDDYGNRNSSWTVFNNDVGDQKEIVVNYLYDSMNRQTNVWGNVHTVLANPPPPPNTPPLEENPGTDEPGLHDEGIESHVVGYDWMGNRISDNKERYTYDDAGQLSQTYTDNKLSGMRRYDGAGQVISDWSRDGTHYNRYDQQARLVAQRNVDDQGNLRSQLAYYYDTAGNLEHYTVVASENGPVQTTTMHYEARDGYLLTETEVSNSPSDRKSSIRGYDANGNLASVNGSDQRVVRSDSNGHILEKVQDGVTTHSLFVNDQLIGSSSKNFESFSSVYDSVSSPAVATPPSVYVVQGTGETARSVAKLVWGDDRLWYLIADVNGGLTADTTLSAGQALRIPTRVNTVLNGYQSFKPYDVSAALGSTTPELAMPQAPQSGGCGGVGTLIMVVVAIAVTYITAGAAANAIFAAYGGAATAAGATAATAAAAGSLSASLSLVAGGAIGAAAGSIASQAVGIGIGAQDGFNWKGVALAAVAGGITAGVGAYGQAAGTSSILNGNGWEAAAARATLSNAISQGVGVVTGLQPSFSWRNVAASAVGSMAGSAAGYGAASVFGADLATATTSGFAAGVVASAMRGGKINAAQIATDAFGNALGSSLAAEFSRPSLPDSMGNLPSDQRRHIQDLAMRTGADLSDPNMADRIQKISELKFAAGQDLSRDDVLDRTSDFLRLRNATDDQISQVRDIYANNKVLPLVGNVEALWNVGKTANDATTRQRTFVGKYIDNAMVGTGNVLSTFGEYVESNPVAKYALEGLDIVTGPAAYALRNFTPVGDLINAAQSKVTGYISGGLQDVGRTDIDAQNGGIGGTAMLSVGAGGFAGMMKGVGSTLDIFKTKRLLPGEGNVATYGELIAAGSKGDNITPHH
ncbi:DUF6531 domain-containing protein, partial [Duganella sp. HH101]|uniref:DUF6531 domain-containing protein n=1 Tax=Duganella sp. HH101 TaxID=1781066 RepID=UPI0008750F67